MYNCKVNVLDGNITIGPYANTKFKNNADL